jgi:hypothetical protein
MLVPDLQSGQRPRECFLIELRIGARPGHRPYVDNEADTGFLQEVDKFEDRPGRVAYGEKGVRVVDPSTRGQPASLILNAQCRKQKSALVDGYFYFEEPTLIVAIGIHAAPLDVRFCEICPMLFFGGIGSNDRAADPQYP